MSTPYRIQRQRSGVSHLIVSRWYFCTIMKRCDRIAVRLVVLAMIALVFYWMVAPLHTPDVTLSHLGFTNWTVHLAFKRGVRHSVVFQLTNHTAMRLTYDVLGYVSPSAGKRPCLRALQQDLAPHGTGTLWMPLGSRSNSWRYEFLTTISESRPIWQEYVGQLCRKRGIPRVFVGPARTFPSFTNVFEISDHAATNKSVERTPVERARSNATPVVRRLSPLR